jgi:hypothetical protein
MSASGHFSDIGGAGEMSAQPPSTDIASLLASRRVDGRAQELQGYPQGANP